MPPIAELPMRRRDFLIRSCSAAAISLAGPPLAGFQAPQRRFTLNLVCGMIGVGAKTQAEVNALAQKHGFESVEARAEEIARMSADGTASLRDDLKARGLVWGAAGLPNGTRVDAASYDDGIKALPTIAAALQRAGVSRVGTWISPGSNDLTYRQNFARHVARVREIGPILGDQGVRFGLEYIGTPTLRRKPRHSFIHTMAEARELFAEVQLPNVGMVLDSWHWFTGGDSGADILALKPADIVAVDMNDAPAGVPIEEQLDNRRELPCTTGVIDMATFVSALSAIGYDGPARAEPFNQALNALDDDEACARTIEALRKAVALIK
jgi:sugar phosphate isomerase/epimerase